MPALGFTIGYTMGNVFFAEHKQGSRLNDKRIQSSEYGNMIPIIYGTMRAAGEVVWQTDLEEHVSGGGGKGGGSGEPDTATYTASFAILLCEGPIVGVFKIWANGRLMYDGTNATAFPFTLYLGDEAQMPDPTMEAHLGAGNVPPMRGLAYIVFTDLDMSQFGNTMPNWSFLISTHAEASNLQRVATFTAWDTAYLPRVGAAFDDDGNIIVAQYAFSGALTHTATFPRIVKTYAPDGSFISSVTTDIPTGGGISGEYTEGIFASENAHIAYSNYVTGDTWLVDGVRHGPVIPGPYVSDYSTAYNDGKHAVTVNAAYMLGSYNLLAEYPNTRATLNKYVITGGVPALTASAGYDFGFSGGGGSQYSVHAGNDGFVYVSNSGRGWWKFDQDLNLVWGPTGAGRVYFLNGEGDCPIANMTGGINMVCSDGTFIADFLAFGGPSISAVFHLRIDTDTGNFYEISRVASTNHAGQLPVLALTNGLAIVTDGLLSVCPSAGTAMPLSEIVADLSVRSGMVAAQYDVEQLIDLIDGYMIGQQMTTQSAIQTLMAGYYFGCVESDCRAKFVKKGLPSCCTVTSNDLGAHVSGTEAPAQIQRNRVDELTLPRSITAVFIDIEFDYQKGAQPWQRQTGEGQTTKTMNMPIAMTNTKGKQIADVNGFAAWLERDRATIQLPRNKYAFLEPTDVITVLDKDYSIVDCTEQMARILRMELVAASSQVWVQGPVASAPTFTPPTIPVAQLSDMILLDIPYFSDSARQGVYWVAARGADRESWLGYSLYKSIDGGANYNRVAANNNPDTFGLSSNALADFTDGFVFDEVNYVDVVIGIGSPAPESASRLAVVNGANLTSLGSEMLAFKNAELIAPLTYRLSGLLRGLYGTESFIGTHTSSEVFCLIPATIEGLSPYGEFNAERQYKAVTSGALLASATEVDFTNTGRALKCYAPVLLGGGRNADGDITLQWVRRGRVNNAWLNSVDVPLGEVDERYRVTIYTDATYATVATYLFPVGVAYTTFNITGQMAQFGHLLSSGYCYWGVQQYGQLGLGTEARSVT